MFGSSKMKRTYNFDVSILLERWCEVTQESRLGVLFSRHIHKIFGVIYLVNVLISLIPIGLVDFNPFQNLFLVDSKSYLCEAWRRAGIPIQEQNFALDRIGRVYGGEGVTCDYLIRSQYPGAPIFSRLLFISPIQIASLVHPIWGPLFLHFTFLFVFFIFVLKVLKSANLLVRVAIISFFLNPSLVYPVFAFATEKYQLLLITYLLVLIHLKKGEKKMHIKFYLAIAALMLLRENLIWGFFFCLYLFFLRRNSRANPSIVLTAFLSMSFSIVQTLFSRFNTPNFVNIYGGDRDFTEFQAAKRVFSLEAFGLLDKSLFADIRVLFTNFTVLDLFTIFSLLFVLIEYSRSREPTLHLLGLFLLGLGLAMDMFSAAFFQDFNVVTFFRLLLPSYWAILVMLSLNKK
jgi:hypothetical protein